MATLSSLLGAQFERVISVEGVFNSDTPPENPFDGMVWTDTTTGIEYTYLEDVDSGQWVEL